jgi:hypothetical protein
MPKKYAALPWKKNFRKIPLRLESKLKGIDCNDIIVACVKKVKQNDIDSGLFKHLGISSPLDESQFPMKILPNHTVGRYSEINISGKEVTRKDLPMITKTFAVDTPNYGDWSYGSHTVYFDREVYIREYIPPKLFEIEIELLGDKSEQSDILLIKFSVAQILDKSSIEFIDDLFFNINLLQENVGNADVFPSQATYKEYLRTIYVDWEILPIGNREVDLPKLVSKFRLKKDDDVKRLADRYDTLTRLRPKEFISGTSGFRRYFGAKFSEELVVFENLEYGNAVYVMYEDWKKLSQKNRIELLKGDNTGFDRVVHTKSWKVQLEYLVRKALGRPIL